MNHKSVRISSNLDVSEDIFQFLINNNSLISEIILNSEFDIDMNYFSSTEFADKISYLPRGKSDTTSNQYGNKTGRITLKIGRFVNKLLSEEMMSRHGVTKHEIEKFVNLYKSWFDPTKYILKVVSGQEIRKWYDEEYYYTPSGAPTGTLWNSCMRYKKRLRQLDLYCENPNIKMLVMLQDVDGEYLVRCRAILWNNVVVDKDFSGLLPNTINIMDRIYSVFDSDVNTFKKWANTNGYVPKYEQNAKTHQFFDIKGEVIRAKCSIVLEKINFLSYPYLDTFPYLNFGYKQISNDEYGFCWDYKLVQANGNLEPPYQEQDDEVTED